MSDAPVIEGFEYIEAIGSGGFADVHLYRQRMPRRTVAVKILRSGELSGAVKRQFIVEANVMARLSNHPGIATIFTAGISSDDRPYLVMEYCPGGSLAQRYRAHPFDIAEAVSIGVRMAAALESAHRVGVVHRDVKPANILISEYGSPVLTDFGIALGHDDSLESTMLQGMTAGSTRDQYGLAYSAPWAAPEVLLETEENDALADVYSLAATVRTLIEGRSPFELLEGNNSLLALSRRVEQGSAAQWSRAGVPNGLVAVIEKAMSVDRAVRYATALDFALALQAVEASEGYRLSNVELFDATVGVGAYAKTSAVERQDEQLAIDDTALNDTALNDTVMIDKRDSASQRESRTSSGLGAPLGGNESDKTVTTPGRKKRLLVISLSGLALLAVSAAGVVIGVGLQGDDENDLVALPATDVQELVPVLASCEPSLQPLQLPVDEMAPFIGVDSALYCGFTNLVENPEGSAFATLDQHQIAFEGGMSEFAQISEWLGGFDDGTECFEYGSYGTTDGFYAPGVLAATECTLFDSGELAVMRSVYVYDRAVTGTWGSVPGDIDLYLVYDLSLATGWPNEVREWTPNEPSDDANDGSSVPAIGFCDTETGTTPLAVDPNAFLTFSVDLSTATCGFTTPKELYGFPSSIHWVFLPGDRSTFEASAQALSSANNGECQVFEPGTGASMSFDPGWVKESVECVVGVYESESVGFVDGSAPELVPPWVPQALRGGSFVIIYVDAP